MQKDLYNIIFKHATFMDRKSWMCTSYLRKCCLLGNRDVGKLLRDERKIYYIWKQSAPLLCNILGTFAKICEKTYVECREQSMTSDVEIDRKDADENRHRQSYFINKLAHQIVKICNWTFPTSHGAGSRFPRINVKRSLPISLCSELKHTLKRSNAKR